MVGIKLIQSCCKIESHAKISWFIFLWSYFIYQISWFNRMPTCLGWVIWWLAWLVNSECDHSSGKLESCNISGIDRGNISEIVLENTIYVTFMLQITFMFCSMKILLTLHVLHNISCLILDLKLSLSIQFQFPNQFDQIKLRIRCFPPCSLLYK